MLCQSPHEKMTKALFIQLPKTIFSGGIGQIGKSWHCKIKENLSHHLKNVGNCEKKSKFKSGLRSSKKYLDNLNIGNTDH